MDRIATPMSPALEYGALRNERDTRAILAADLFEGAQQWDARAERAARDGHDLLTQTCRRNAALLRERAHVLLEKCP
jgi:hypothetical protein